MKIDISKINSEALKIGMELANSLQLGMDFKKRDLAYVVGGCVRDLVRAELGQTEYPEIHDVDIATNRPMDDIIRNFRIESNNGEAHGTLLVFRKGIPFEVTQFRTDGEYTDGRHPDSVKFAKTFEEAHEIIQKRSRYSKIIIATDSDSDGSAIFNEIIYLFSKFARFLIDHGMVYRALSPLFRGRSKTTGKITYYYPDDPIDTSTTLPVDLDTSYHFDRWKGLGSLTPESGEVYDAFYNPQTRRLIQITPEGLDYSRKLNENINERKKLLFDKGILSNPYGFDDL